VAFRLDAARRSAAALSLRSRSRPESEVILVEPHWTQVSSRVVCTLRTLVLCLLGVVGFSACSAAPPVEPDHIGRVGQAVTLCSSWSQTGCWQTSWSGPTFNSVDFAYNLMCGSLNASGPSSIIQCFDSNGNFLTPNLSLPPGVTVRSVSAFVGFGVQAQVYALGSDSILYTATGTLPPSGAPPYFGSMAPLVQPYSMGGGVLDMIKVVVVNVPSLYAPNTTLLGLDSTGHLWVKRRADTLWYQSNWPNLVPWENAMFGNWKDISRDPKFGAYLLDTWGDVWTVGQGTIDGQGNITYTLPEQLPVLPYGLSVTAVGGPFVLSNAGEIPCSSDPQCQAQSGAHGKFVYPLTVNLGFDGDSARFWYWNGSVWTNLAYGNPNLANYSNCDHGSTPINQRCFSSGPPYVDIVEATSLSLKAGEFGLIYESSRADTWVP
jgi:hypothetical protein